MENSDDYQQLTSTDIKNVGSRIRKARKELKLTQTELGDRINLSRITVSQIENGKRRHINPDIILRMAQALSKPKTYFYNPLQENHKEIITKKKQKNKSHYLH